MVGVLVTLAAVLAAGWAYLHYGHPSAAIKRSAATLIAPSASSPAPPPAPTHTPQQIKQPPFGISEDVFESGAHLYSTHCASCHGVPGRIASARPGTPPAPQLWTPLPHSLGVGVSSLPPGEIFARIEDGVHPPAMPAYRLTLSSIQIWQLSLLLKNAAQPLPDPVLQILAQSR